MANFKTCVIAASFPMLCASGCSVLFDAQGIAPPDVPSAPASGDAGGETLTGSESLEGIEGLLPIEGTEGAATGEGAEGHQANPGADGGPGTHPCDELNPCFAACDGSASRATADACIEQCIYGASGACATCMTPVLTCALKACGVFDTSCIAKNCRKQIDVCLSELPEIGTGKADAGVGPGTSAPDAGPPDAGPPCQPRGQEVCNGEDDDCDGEIDEGKVGRLKQTCATACGDGVKVCENGQYGECSAPLECDCEPGTQEVQSCGQCGSRQRECLATRTWSEFTACAGEHEGNACGGCAALPLAPSEACGTGGCGKVVCESEEAVKCEDTGLKACVDFTACATFQACTCPPAPAETCNARDDDCDGQIDEPGDSPCGEGKSCRGGICVDECADLCPEDGKSECIDNTRYRQCGQFNADSCLEWSVAVACQGNQECRNGQCGNCQKDCANKACGPDGCGGVCGSCGANEVCASGACVCQFGVGAPPKCCGPGQVVFNGICCTPQCAGKSCGSDSCGGRCGDCTVPGQECASGACQCTPEASEKCVGNAVYAFDSCGNQGELKKACKSTETCANGECKCATTCEGKVCGDDGCGNLCPEQCPATKICVEGGTKCVECMQKSDCKDAALPLCDTSRGVCVECLAEADCATKPTTPHCQLSANKCVECTALEHCTTPQEPACKSATGTCGACTSSADCTRFAETPVCNANAGNCVECVTASDCPAGLQCLSFACTRPWPDTGQTGCYDNATGLPTCSETGDYGSQDAVFTAVNQIFASLDGSTVQDQVTGLYWEKNVNPTKRDYANAKTYCQGLSSSGKTWRLPAVAELLSIASFGHLAPASPPSLPTPAATERFWASDVVSADGSKAWAVSFHPAASAGVAGKTVLGYVRCVSGPILPPSPGAPGTPETYYDKTTNLTWQIQGLQTNLKWKDALAFCANATYHGISDWRVPTVKELATIVDYTRSSPAIDPARFPGTPASVFWTSTTNLRKLGEAVVIDFATGEVVYNFTNDTRGDKNTSRAVRCVRAGSSCTRAACGGGTCGQPDGCGGVCKCDDDVELVLSWDASGATDLREVDLRMTTPTGVTCPPGIEFGSGMAHGSCAQLLNPGGNKDGLNLAWTGKEPGGDGTYMVSGFYANDCESWIVVCGNHAPTTAVLTITVPGATGGVLQCQKVFNSEGETLPLANLVRTNGKITATCQ